MYRHTHTPQLVCLKTSWLILLIKHIPTSPPFLIINTGESGRRSREGCERPRPHHGAGQGSGDEKQLSAKAEVCEV